MLVRPLTSSPFSPSLLHVPHPCWHPLLRNCRVLQTLRLYPLHEHSHHPHGPIPFTLDADAILGYIVRIEGDGPLAAVMARSGCLFHRYTLAHEAAVLLDISTRIAASLRAMPLRSRNC